MSGNFVDNGITKYHNAIGALPASTGAGTGPLAKFPRPYKKRKLGPVARNSSNALASAPPSPASALSSALASALANAATVASFLENDQWGLVFQIQDTTQFVHKQRPYAQYFRRSIHGECPDTHAQIARIATPFPPLIGPPTSPTPKPNGAQSCLIIWERIMHRGRQYCEQ